MNKTTREALGIVVNKPFELKGKTYTIDSTFSRYYMVYCITTGETLCTRGLLETCANKVWEHSQL